MGGGGFPRRLIRSPGRLSLFFLFPDRRDEIDPGVDAGPAKDLIDAVLIALGDLEMPRSVVEPMDRDMRQVLEHLPSRGLGHHPPGRPVKGLLGLPHLVLDEHIDQGGQKKDHPQGLQPLFLLQEEGVEDDGILDEGPEDVFGGGLPLVFIENRPGGSGLLEKSGDEESRPSDPAPDSRPRGRPLPSSRSPRRRRSRGGSRPSWGVRVPDGVL